MGRIGDHLHGVPIAKDGYFKGCSRRSEILRQIGQSQSGPNKMAESAG